MEPIASSSGKSGDRRVSSTGKYPALQRLTDIVMSVWPEHAAYIEKSLAARTEALLDTSDKIAEAILQLAAPEEINHAEDYRWLCAQIMEEELYFSRHEKYRYSTFEETNRYVYSDHDFMRRYMNGLLYSQVLWFMHASSLHFFRQRVASRVAPGGSVLEVGSGHGLLLYLALRDLGMGRAVAWDLSQVSLDQTRKALGRLGALDRAEFAIQDVHAADPTSEQFDLVILSHLLEHLENPVSVLQSIRSLLRKGGHLYVNVPLNAPMPDHLVLLETPAEVTKMLADGGFNILEVSYHTTQAAPLSKALRTKTAVTCSLICEPA